MAVFDALLEGVAPAFLQRGFVKHPSYEDGWDPYNQEYTINLVRNEFRDHIYQLKITYWPRDSRVGVEIIRSENAFAIESLEDFPAGSADWTDQWLYEPFTTLKLQSGNTWNPFSIKNAFKLTLAAQRDPGVELERLVVAINKKVPYLIEAMKEPSRSAHVDVVEQHIRRPSS